MNDDDIDRRLRADATGWNRDGSARIPSLDGFVERVTDGVVVHLEVTSVPAQERPSVRQSSWPLWVTGAAAVLLVALIVAFTLSARGSGRHAATPVTPSAVPAPDSAARSSVGTLPPAGRTDIPLVCPRSVSDGALTVPHAATIPFPGDRLVPDETPTAAVVCPYLYAAALPAPLSLTVAVPVVSGLDLIRSLSSLPVDRPASTHPCPKDTRVPYEAALVGIRYPDGIVWVAAPLNDETCGDTTNGVFNSFARIGDVVAALLTANGSSAGRAEPGPTPSVLGSRTPSR